MSNIIPTVSRKVWYYDGNWQREPHDATVIKVHSSPESATPDTHVNLLVVDPDNGVTRCELMVAAGNEGTQWRHYRWMPYQQSQAKKDALNGGGYVDGTPVVVAATGDLS